MNVPFLDLRITDSAERSEILEAVGEVLDHGRLVMGPEIDRFEHAVAEYCGRKHCVSVASGTDALFLGLKGLSLRAGDEVITTALSWVATANAISLTGATPVFADIQSDLNIDPASVESLITPKTKAILAVNYTGKICSMERLERLAKDRKLHLVEDGAQAFGAARSGRRCGSFGTLSAISHNPMKVFAALGEAGSILCDDDELRERLVSLRYNGTVNRETCIEPSLNGRMDTLHAAILLRRMKRLENVISCRRKNASTYSERLRNIVVTPIERPGEQDVYYTYTIRSSRRDELRDYLAAKGIETKIQHPLLMPEQPAYKNHRRANLRRAQAISKQYLCIPVHEKLMIDQVNYVSDAIASFGPSMPDPVE
jgi:dTDP-4-amino-4,6-dideoxygalactose transaminase